MNKSSSIGKLALALSKLQGEMEGAAKDSSNPFFKSKYTSLEGVWDACKALLSKNELSVSQVMGFTPEAGPTLTTTLMHSSGEWIEGTQPLCAKGATPQDLGSAISYARRYGLAAIVGVVQVDDDGNAASGRSAPGTQNKPVGPGDGGTPRYGQSKGPSGPLANASRPPIKPIPGGTF